MSAIKAGLFLWLVTFAATLAAFLDNEMWLRRRQPGLNTEADADEYVEELRADPPAPFVRRTPAVRRPVVLGLKPAPVAMVRTETVFAGIGTPIFDGLVADIKRRKRALRWPTQEMRTMFDALTAAWRCSHCAEDDCRSCPGCSCNCRMEVAAA
jgi:hypothetical protein